MTDTLIQAAHTKAVERIKAVERMHSDFICFGLPQGMWGGIKRYLTHGIGPGHFLTAVLENDLAEAIARADEENMNLLPQYVKFFYNCVPGGAWHSKANVKAWREKGGLIGGAQ